MNSLMSLTKVDSVLIDTTFICIKLRIAFDFTLNTPENIVSLEDEGF